MREVVSKVYQFDELSDTAKDTAREWYRRASDGDNYFAESVIEDAATIADIIGINLRQRPVKLMNGSTRYAPEVWWEGFSHQGQGASYSGTYAYAKGAVKKLAVHAPTGEGKDFAHNNEVNRIARDLADVQRRNFYALTASVSATHRGHWLVVDVERTDDNPMTSDAIDTVSSALRDFADWIYRNLETEYEYQNSDEQIDETMRANEYEFTEDGKRA